MVVRLNGLYLLLGDAAVKCGVNQVDLCMELAQYASDSIKKDNLNADDYPNVQKFIEKLKERISEEDDTIEQDRKVAERIINEWDKKAKKDKKYKFHIEDMKHLILIQITIQISGSSWMVTAKRLFSTNVHAQKNYTILP